MRQRFAWAIGLIFLVAQFAAGQGYRPYFGGGSFGKTGNIVQAGQKDPDRAETGGPEALGAPKKDGATDVPERLMAPSTFDESLFPNAYPNRPLIYGGADLLLWWVHRGPSPTLLTTAPNNGRNNDPNTGNPVLTGGILGQPGTQPLFTSHNLDYHMIPGGRLLLGTNLSSDRFWGVELSAFYLRQASVDFSRSGNPNTGMPLLTIPFLDAATGQQNSLDLSSQDINGAPYLAGSISIHSDLSLYGYDVNLVAHSVQTPDRTFDMLFGYRGMYLTENLAIRQNITALQDGSITTQFPTVGQGSANYFNVPAGQSVTIIDRFGTRNQFNGASVGGRFGWYGDRWTFNLTGKVAFGVTYEQVSIDGTTSATAGLNTTTKILKGDLTTPGGVFALQNNSGLFHQNQFSVVPEANLDFRYALTSWAFLRVGYSAMYWSNVARPGAQIDPVLNSKLIPTGALINPQGAILPGQEQGRPYFNFHDTSFWAHGVNFGVELRY